MITRSISPSITFLAREQRAFRTSVAAQARRTAAADAQRPRWVGSIEKIISGLFGFFKQIMPISLDSFIRSSTRSPWGRSKLKTNITLHPVSHPRRISWYSSSRTPSSSRPRDPFEPRRQQPQRQARRTGAHPGARIGTSITSADTWIQEFLFLAALSQDRLSFQQRKYWRKNQKRASRK